MLKDCPMIELHDGNDLDPLRTESLSCLRCSGLRISRTRTLPLPFSTMLMQPRVPSSRPTRT
jgi:hypothetical protein